ncbi:putative HTH-type transcriptional regulator [subsurface metagenome]
MDGARPTIDGIAGRLGLSRRTLQRRLEETGRRYADLHRSVLIRRAKALLSDETLPIGRIGVELGYAYAAHFSRAFLHWTGTTPSDWRRRTHMQLRPLLTV